MKNVIINANLLKKVNMLPSLILKNNAIKNNLNCYEILNKILYNT